MGLIKTAIMTGGGIYAVKKISKAHQQSQNQQFQNNQQQYNQPPPPQGYWGPPAPGKEHLGPVWHAYPPPPSSLPKYENDNQRGLFIEGSRDGMVERRGDNMQQQQWGNGGGDLPAYVYGGKN